MKILAILPAYNEAATVGRVIAATRRVLPHIDVVVVNDCSTDATAKVAREAGATVLDLPCNLGIGGAMQTGYRYALAQGYEVAVQIDADGQHDPADLPALLAPLLAGEADLVIGSRFRTATGYRGSQLRQVGIRFFAWLLTRLTGQRLYDTTSGFRAASRPVIAYFAQEYPVDYPEVEVLLALRRRGFRLSEVPVTMGPRQAGRSSITLSRSVYYMVKVVVALAVQLLRPRVKGGPTL